VNAAIDLSARPHPRGEHRRPFAAMGTTGEIVVVGGSPTLADEGLRRLEWLEARWSRFRPGSDVSALNRAAGSAVAVAPETVLLIDRAVRAAAATDGRYDPTVGRAVIAHGYDRTFAAVGAAAARLEPNPEVDGSWPMIELDRTACTVALAEGTIFDPGGIGKGLAADLVAADLAAEADGVLVNLGGDVRFTGRAPTAEGWVVTVEDPLDPAVELARLALPSGAVATSSVLRRAWQTATGPAHHLIDPRTGRPAATGVVSVTTVAAEGWWAEVQAKSLLLAGPDALDALRPDDGVEALLTLADGTRRATPSMAACLR
jgi:thiamine biosynthesis lipoprotein